MDSIENDFPQAKANRQPKVGHEYCRGYFDQNGIWNNGFYCRRWGGPDETYCCGDGREKFCCPELTTMTTPAALSASFAYIPIVIGASLGLALLLLFILLLGCFLCPCCTGFKWRRRRRSQPRPIVIGRTLSVSMEAEATSAVIAAQALVPLQGCSSSGQGSSSAEDGHLHCGCRWSPSDSTTTVVDIDTLVTSMYQNATLPWQPELDNMYNYSCELRPNNCRTKEQQQQQQQLQQQQQQQQLSSSSSSSSYLPLSARFKLSSGPVGQSPYCLDPFHRYNPPTVQRESSDESSRHTTLERGSKPRSLRRTYGLVSSGSGGGGGSKDGGPGTAASVSLLDPDGHRRDSGVLVEDQDTTGSGNSLQAFQLPTLELTSIGRISAGDRRTGIDRKGNQNGGHRN